MHTNTRFSVILDLNFVLGQELDLNLILEALYIQLPFIHFLLFCFMFIQYAPAESFSTHL